MLKATTQILEQNAKEHSNDHKTQSANGSKNNQNQDDQINNQDIAAAWYTLKNIYGGLFNQYGEAPNPLWVDEMKKLTQQELKRGIEACKYNSQLPNLPEFLFRCRHSKNKYGSITAAYKNDVTEKRLITSKVASDEVKKKYLNMIKENLT